MLIFRKVNKPDPKVYYIDSNKKIINFPNRNRNFEIYEPINATGFITVIRIDSYNFKILGRVRSKENSFEIFPKFDSLENKQKTRNFEFYDHVVIEKGPIDDNLIQMARKIQKKKSKLPLELKVETLAVIDNSVYENFKQVTMLNDTNILFEYIKVYYMHLFDEVDSKFENSFGNDPFIRIQIVLKNILITTFSENAFYKAGVGFGEGLLASDLLNNFSNFMRNSNQSNTFDHAIAFIRKDIWKTEKKRQILGISYTKGICSKDKYSVIEDIGGFSNVYVIAHELGHNLGAGHDQEISSNNKNIMATPLSYQNMSSLQRFSQNSINEIRNFLMNISKSSNKKNLHCLLKSIEGIRGSSENLNLSQKWSADDQCKLRYGRSASLCEEYSSQMCSTLICRKNSSTSICIENIEQHPASDGTICGENKICHNGQCISSNLNQVNECPFGDRFVPNGTLNDLTYASSYLKCPDFLNLLHNNTKAVFCRSQEGKKFCCQSCSRYRLLSCVDDDYDCSQKKHLCYLIKNRCKKTCAICKAKPLRCNTNKELCKNNGRCVNVQSESNAEFGYKCICKEGFSGPMCEKKNPCLPNPCKNKKCHRIGESNFICKKIL
ncbi:unnamed protein product [Brachionus calyciflorus]|uniref:Uncharacterized protein n=1 Tax=Brachionus calyciflorus TaxID=104777 RepID=A0A813Q347_9BILA|nr:unnamed protein product [Brachionus calyciflorus]